MSGSLGSLALRRAAASSSLKDQTLRRAAASAIANRVAESRAASTLGPKRKDGDEAASASARVADGVAAALPKSGGKKTRILPRLRSHSSLAASSAEEHPHHVHPAGPGLDSFRAIQERNDGSSRTPFDDAAPSSKGTAIGLEELRELASRKTTPLTLANMYRYARGDDPDQRLRNARFLHRELPIRIAQRAVDLLTLPHGLNKTRPIRGIAETYLSYLEKFRRMPCPTNAEEESKFTLMLEGLVQDRTAIPMAIARGVSSLRDARREELDVRRLQEIEDALYRFFTARVGLRFLTEHHILSSPERKEAIRKERKMTWLQKSVVGVENVNELEIGDSKMGGSGKFLGCIQMDCDPVGEVRAVADQVVRKTRDCYGVSPRIEIVDCTEGTNAGKVFTYVPHHLQYMLAELLKNSCRATVRRYLDGEVTQKDHASHRGDDDDDAGEDGQQSDSDSDEESNLPPVRVVVVKGAEDVSIKIADRGGGVPRSAMKKIWTFAHSTLGSGPAFDVKEATSDFGTDEFTGGRIRGFGLPLARTYARYFGGELTLKSMEGYGVDAYLYLPMLGVACENLPRRVDASPGNRDSHPVEDGRIGNPKFSSSSYHDGSGATRSGSNGQTFAPQRPGLEDFWAEKNKASSSSLMKMLAQRAL